MKLYEPISEESIINEVDSLCNTTKNSYTLKKKIARANEALDQYWFMAAKAAPQGTLDDTSNTSAPIEKQIAAPKPKPIATTGTLVIRSNIEGDMVLKIIDNIPTISWLTEDDYLQFKKDENEIDQMVVYNGIVDSVAYHPGGNQAVPLAIDSAGVGGGALISALVAGQTVQVANNSLGEIVNLKLTAAMVASLQSTLVASGGVVPDTATIEPAVKVTAGTGISNVDMILVAVQDQSKAIYDKIAQVKTRIKVGLTKGFAPVVRKVEVSTPYEGQNTGRELKLYYNSTAGLRNYNGQELSGLDGGALKYPDTIDESKNYAVYTILHSDVDSTTQGTPSEAPLVTVVLVEEGDSDTKTAIEAVLNPYFKTIPFASFEGETTAAGVVIA